MLNVGSNLPFSPHLFEAKFYTITSTSATQKICGIDSKRVYLSIWEPSNPIVINPFISFMQSNGFVASRPITAINFTEISAYDHYILQTSEVYINNYPVFSTFSVIEVIYTLPNTKDNYNDPKKPRTLADKIKDFVLSSRRGGGVGNS